MVRCSASSAGTSIRCGTVRVERTLHEFHDGSLDLGPTKNGDPRKVYLPSSVLPALEDHR